MTQTTHTSYFDTSGAESVASGNATVSLDLHGHVALISMLDAERHNAMTPTHVRAMVAAIDSSQLKKARAVVITSGVKNFCAGADVVQLLQGRVLEPGPKDPDAVTPLRLFRRLVEDTRPVILAINGLALGGGMEMALSSDLVFAAPEARFAMPELGLGLLPRMALVRLCEVVGRRKAMELILTRRKFTAEHALQIGLLTDVIPAGELVATAIRVASDIVTAPPAVIAAVKKNLGRVAIDDWNAVEDLLKDMNPSEWQEGLSAFLEKRTPDFEQFWQR